MAGLNVDDILKKLGRQKTAEEQLAEGLSEKPAEVKTDAPVEEKKAEEAPVEAAPVEAAPVEEAPVEAAPVEEAPVEATTTEVRTEAEVKLAEAEKAFNEAKALVEAEKAEKNAEAEKKAAEELERVKEAEDTGRIMARGFHDELKKLASEETLPESNIEPEIPAVSDDELQKSAQVLINLHKKFFGGNE